MRNLEKKVYHHIRVAFAITIEIDSYFTEPFIGETTSDDECDDIRLHRLMFERLREHLIR